MSTLVIGVGSDLRSDDRVGREVAERIAALDLDGVEVESRHQLVPELAERIARCGKVIVVDASVEVDTVSVETLETPAVASAPTSHVATPVGLVALAGLLAGRRPTAHVVSVPATELSLGEELSDRAADAVDEAVQRVLDLIDAPAARVEWDS